MYCTLYSLWQQNDFSGFLWIFAMLFTWKSLTAEKTENLNDVIVCDNTVVPCTLTAVMTFSPVLRFVLLLSLKTFRKKFDLGRCIVRRMVGIQNLLLIVLQTPGHKILFVAGVLEVHFFAFHLFPWSTNGCSKTAGNCIVHVAG